MRLLAHDSDEFAAFVIRQVGIAQHPTSALDTRNWRYELPNQAGDDSVHWPDLGPARHLVRLSSDQLLRRSFAMYGANGIRAALGESGRDQRYADKQNPLNDRFNL